MVVRGQVPQPCGVLGPVAGVALLIGDQQQDVGRVRRCPICWWCAEDVAAQYLVGGPELTARVLREWCEQGSTATAYIEPGSPWQNPWIESFNARVRDELLDVEEFSSLAEAQVLAADYRLDYNANHPHSALGMMSPSRFAASWQRIGGTNGTVNPELSDGVDR